MKFLILWTPVVVWQCKLNSLYLFFFFVFFTEHCPHAVIDMLNFLFILLRQLEHVCVVQFACISVCTSAEGQQEWCIQVLLEIKPICVHRWRSGGPQQFLQHLGDHGYFQTPPLRLQPQHRLHLLLSTSLQAVSTHMHFSVTLHSRDRRLQSSRAGFNPGFEERSGTSGECAVHL